VCSDSPPVLSLGFGSVFSRRDSEGKEAMPPAKKTTREAAKNTAKKGAAQRTLSAAHKKALAEGRTMSASVDRYLAVVNAPQRRGRKVSKATLTERLTEARVRAKSATGVDRVLAAQAVRDLERRVAQLDSASGDDVKRLESDFVKLAKKFGEQRGISYGAWRDAGISAQVLKRAGIPRTRG